MQRYGKLTYMILFAILAIALLGSVSCSQALSSPAQAPPAKSPEATPNPNVEQSEPAKVADTTPSQTVTVQTPSPKTVETPTTQTIYDVDITQYQITIDGLVSNPLVLTYEVFKKYPSVTVEALLVCPGVFEYTANWTGVPVTTLLAEAGIAPQASQVAFYAWDGYKSVLPLKEVQKDGVLVAYYINGKPLTRDDGYPLRLVMKGKGGDVWVRWLNRIEVK